MVFIERWRFHVPTLSKREIASFGLEQVCVDSTRPKSDVAEVVLVEHS